jgi:hypothetical protein
MDAMSMQLVSRHPARSPNSGLLLERVSVLVCTALYFSFTSYAAHSAFSITVILQLTHFDASCTALYRAGMDVRHAPSAHRSWFLCSASQASHHSTC